MHGVSLYDASVSAPVCMSLLRFGMLSLNIGARIPVAVRNVGTVAGCITAEHLSSDAPPKHRSDNSRRCSPF